MADDGNDVPEGEEEEPPLQVPETLNLLAFWDICKTFGEKGDDLSDCTVKLADEGGEGDEAPPAEAAEGEAEDPDAPPPEPSEFKCHKIALCSASGYFFEQFVCGKAEDPANVELPKLPDDVHVKTEVPVGKIFPLVLRYIYSNQNYSVISDDVTETNAVGVWALATLLDIKTLIQHSRDFIEQTVLDATTASRLMYIAVQFGDAGQPLQEVCMNKLMSEFSFALDASYESDLKVKEEGLKEEAAPPSGLDLLCKLPVDTLVALLDSDELNVRSEYEVFSVIRHLLHERLDRDESILTLSEIKLTDVSSDRFPKKAPHTAVWELILKEGPARPEFGSGDAHTPVTKKYSIKSPAVKIQVEEDGGFDLSNAMKEIQFEGEGDPPDNQDQLVLTFPTKGLTARSGYVILQAVIETEVSGSIQRELLAEGLVPPQAWLGGEIEGAAPEGEGEEGGAAEFKFEMLCAGAPVATVVCNKDCQPKDPPAEEDGGGGGGGEGEDDEQPVITGGPLTADETKKILQCLRFPELRHEELVEANEDPWFGEADAQPYIIEAFSTRLSKIEPIYTGRPGQDLPKGPRPSTLGRSGGAKQGRMRPHMPKSPSHGQPPGRELALVQSPTHQRPAAANQLAIPGQDLSQGVASPATPIYFDHISDFDENGALYYLGTRGISRVWANPCGLPQPVTVLTSGIGFGTREDFVGRAVVNLRTRNEPGSYLGVDLGGGPDPRSVRLLRIRGYCLRSRNATSHAPICWDFQGSVDGSNWETLDQRRNERSLTAKCVSAFFQVQPPPPAFPTRGHPPGRGGEEPAYRCFRILQPPGERNSSGSDNLVLSGIELYGEAVQGPWT